MRILCAVDGSEHSRWGVQALEALAGREPEHVALLHIIDQPTLQAAKNKNLVTAKRAIAAMEKAGIIVLRDGSPIGPTRPRASSNRATHKTPDHPHAWSVRPCHCEDSQATENRFDPDRIARPERHSGILVGERLS